MKNVFYVSDECWYKIFGDDFVNAYREFLGDDSHNDFRFQQFLFAYMKNLIVDSGDFGGDYHDLLEYVNKNL